MTTQQTGGGELLTELGFYALAGHRATPRDPAGEVRQAERLGIGAAFIPERFSTKEAASTAGIRPCWTGLAPTRS
ncbi:hypothetical protein [Pseudofrankia sp. DC12]|uniref:hypothetical protein n=1 Tax=Pseudofrankia sp. DC12 TaxID=683315 RepID=UPI0005F7C63B|nr:hypothetical protein [Pseudofrankia sp. DC12]